MRCFIKYLNLVLYFKLLIQKIKGTVGVFAYLINEIGGIFSKINESEQLYLNNLRLVSQYSVNQIKLIYIFIGIST